MTRRLHAVITLAAAAALAPCGDGTSGVPDSTDTPDTPAAPLGVLAWPIDCIPGQTCAAAIGYPDTDGDGTAFNCGAPGYTGHQGTDVNITWSQMDLGVDVLAAADGTVLWVFDGKYDRCPNPSEPG